MNTANEFEFPELKVHNINGLRFYETPEGLKYPSITTVLGKQPGKQKGLQEWRERVGEQQANIIAGKAARRGSVFHQIVEDYLNSECGFFVNTQIDEYKQKNFLAWCMFGEMRPYLDECLTKTIIQEQNMYSNKYKVAGRCDFVGVYKDTITVVDFKTATKMKKEEWCEDYFIQCAAYASMYEENTGIGVDDIAIMMVAEDGQVNLFEKKTFEYLDKLEVIMEEFYNNLDYKELAA